MLSPATDSVGRLHVVAHKSWVQNVQKAQRVACATEEDVEKMDFKFPCIGCERTFLYDSSLAIHVLLD